jgi:hypothetical protein
MMLLVSLSLSTAEEKKKLMAASELDKRTQGYTEYDRTMKVGDWAIIN